MKLHILKSGENFSFSNFEFKENGQTSFEMDFNEEDYKGLFEGEKELKEINGIITVVNSTKKQEMLAAQEAEAQQKLELKSRLESGTASLEEIQSLLSKLL